MVARALLVLWCPGIDVNVLEVDTAGCDGAGDPDMVELLRVLVEGVGVAFLGWDLSDLVEGVHEVLEGLEHGACLPEFVVISGNDYAGKGVKLENGFDEILHQYTM